MNVLARELEKWYDTIDAVSFYREIFPVGELDEYEAMTKGKYTAIALEIIHQGKGQRAMVKRYSVTDDLLTIDKLTNSKNFCVIAPISYAGKSRDSKNARNMYALVVELDNLIVDDTGSQEGLYRLVNQWSEDVHWIPKPTYVICSGTGLHLYYQWERPIPLFANVVDSLQRFKRELTKKIWNSHVTLSHTPETIQQESIFQGFRMVGTVTKLGDKVEAFKVGEKVSISYMNSFLTKATKESESNEIVTIYKSNLTKERAKELYPEWYSKRIENKEKKGSWTCKPALYEWWLARIKDEAIVGHRYYCLMMLSIYAIKCNIDEERLIQDSFDVMEIFEKRTDNPSNHFTEKDVIDALQSFCDKGLVTYPINSIANRSGLKIEKNKRNYRKQELHLKLARATKSILKEAGELETEGRPSKRMEVVLWKQANPSGDKKACIEELHLSRSTVFKYW